MNAPAFTHIVSLYFVLGLGLGIPLVLAGCERQDTSPRQPIAFSHAIHAGQYQIACQYCHSGVRSGANA
ncbi:MAG: cytochrome c3 family protein, partial [Bacteroidota bacterium]